MDVVRVVFTLLDCRTVNSGSSFSYSVGKLFPNEIMSNQNTTYKLH